MRAPDIVLCVESHYRNGGTALYRDGVIAVRTPAGNYLVGDHYSEPGARGLIDAFIARHGPGKVIEVPRDGLRDAVARFHDMEV